MTQFELKQKIADLDAAIDTLLAEVEKSEAVTEGLKQEVLKAILEVSELRKQLETPCTPN